MSFCMRIFNNKKIWILAALFLLLSIGILFGMRRGETPPVKKGCVDFWNVDLRSKKAVELWGEWEFFAYKHLVTELLEGEEPDGYVKVPSYQKRRAEEPIAWGSYRITMENCPPDVTVSLTLRGMPSAYRIFINGESVEKSGIVSTNRSVTSVHGGVSQEIAFTLHSDVCELVVETSGQLLPGLSIAPRIQEYGTWQQEYNRYRAVVLLLFGMHILFVASYLIQLILNPRSGFSWAMLGALTLLLLKGLASDIPFSSLLGQTAGGYDRFQLWMYVAQFVMWDIVLGIYYGDHRKRKSRHLGWKEAVLSVGVLAAVFGVIQGETDWWFYLDGAVWIVLAVRLINFVRHRGACGLECFWEEAGLQFLWFGCAMSDLAMMGIRSYPYKMGFFLGVITFDLAVNVIDRFRMKGIQQKALEVLRIEGELQQAKMELALRQIKPHFLQNALMSIKVLCRTRPREAEQAIYDFAVFLRSNMNAIESSVPIAFTEELRTIQGYLHIEKLRFGDRIQVVWDIQEEHFLILPLTIQPLVENAVRHGICQKIEGGTVTIATRRKQKEILVEIRDDGVGFDVAKAESSEGIGIRNLRLRLDKLLHASLEIYSRPGEGCIQIVRIPADNGREEHEDYIRR